jgi:two-component system, chemotaxis family, protein-glutamate methylesterase/glutaminase
MSERKQSRKIVVSVIESDVLMRQILSSMLRKEPGIHLAGSMGFGDAEAHLSVLKNQRPDLLMLGVDSIGSGAMDFFYRVRREHPDLYIGLLTPLSREGASVALEGLKQGAVDYITKPDKKNGLILASRHFHKRVLPLVKAVPRLNRARTLEYKHEIDDRRVTESLTMGRSRMVPNGTELIVIGSCLGGVASLYKVVAGLPDQLPVPVVIVQHMPKIYTEEFAEDLDKITPLNVREAKDYSVLVPGQVYVAPGGYHSVIKSDGCRKQIILHRGPREHKFRPSIDVLLRSAVQIYGSRILSVFLSGGGSDGIKGAALVLDRGGKVLLESRESSLLWGMAGDIKGLREEIESYPADRLPTEIMNCLKSQGSKRNFPSRMDESTDVEWFPGSAGN